MAGTFSGVFRMPRPGAAGTAWIPLGSGLPNALVLDLHYDYTNATLAAGLLGRGAWLVNNPFSVTLTTKTQTYDPAQPVPGSLIGAPLAPPAAQPP
jgi:hypothetical protein